MSLRTIRRVATAVLLADVVVLGAASVEVTTVAQATTTTQTPTASVAHTQSVPATDSAPLTHVSATALGGGTALVTTTFPETRPATHASHTHQSGKPVTPTVPTGATDPSKAIPPCPVKVATTQASGGLQSLIPFAPVFGPYSAEAFALASTYQPELQLIGPLLAQYPQLAPVVGPILTPSLASFGNLLNLGYTASEPLYGPYRTQFIDAETKLAAALSPYSESLAYNKLGGCLVELENALVAADKPSATAPAATPARVAPSLLGVVGIGQ